MEVLRTLGDELGTAGVIHPVSVTGGCTAFAVTPSSASSSRGGHRVADQRGLGRAVGRFLGEPEGPPDVRLTIRPQLAPRAMCRRANSAMSSAAAAHVDRGLLVDRLGRDSPARVPRRSTGFGRNESAIQPVALLTRMSTGPSAVVGAVEEVRYPLGLGEIRFSATADHDLVHQRARILATRRSIGLRGPDVSRILDAQVAHTDTSHRAPRRRCRDSHR